MVKNAIKVFARLRPEKRRKSAVNYQIHRRPDEKHREEDFLVLTTSRGTLKEFVDNRPESWNFSFYKIFDEEERQERVFEDVARPIVHSVLDGYNATIFAYGQTGSGKTYTITGDQKHEERGILPRTIEYLFDVIRKNPENLYSVEISYLEIYNENGYDLLDPRHQVATKLEDLPRVTIQEDESGVLHLKNLSFRSIENENDALSLLLLGDTNRAVSETPMNPQSSRSHCIFTIVVSVKRFGAEHYNRAKMHLVDLAGSERVYKCAITGTILTEAKHINLSLHYLEQVIVCLGQENTTHIPYRNSLLTAILRDSLGGNCLTTMLATLSVAATNLEETISTCRFAQRVALIRNDVNLVFERDAKSENMFLRMEIERLKQQIERMKTAGAEELSETEKRDLESRVGEFLASDSCDALDNDPRKIRYCLEVVRKNFRCSEGEKACPGTCARSLQYYKNLVEQRDREISLLTNKLKKERASDVERSTGSRKSDEKSSAKFTKEQSKRLKEIVCQMKSIAKEVEGNRSIISELRSKVDETLQNPVEESEVKRELKLEQSKLAENLSTLRYLKKKVLMLRSQFSASTDDQNQQSTATVSPKISKKKPATTSKDDNSSRNKYYEAKKVVVNPARIELPIDEIRNDQLIVSTMKSQKIMTPNTESSTFRSKKLARKIPMLDLTEKSAVIMNRQVEKDDSVPASRCTVSAIDDKDTKYPSKEKTDAPIDTPIAPKEIADPHPYKTTCNDTKKYESCPTKTLNVTEIESVGEHSKESKDTSFSDETTKSIDGLRRRSDCREKNIDAISGSALQHDAVRRAENAFSVQKNSFVAHKSPKVSREKIIGRLFDNRKKDIPEIPLLTSNANNDWRQKYPGSPERTKRSEWSLKNERNSPDKTSKCGFGAANLLRSMFHSEKNSGDKSNWIYSSDDQTSSRSDSKRMRKTAAELIQEFRDDLQTQKNLMKRNTHPNEEILNERDYEKKAIKEIPKRESERRLLEIDEGSFNAGNADSAVCEDAPKKSRDQDHEINANDLSTSSAVNTSLEVSQNKFDKSLPLTGDPEIDEEIIAFYKAKRSGGTY